MIKRTFFWMIVVAILAPVRGYADVAVSLTLNRTEATLGDAIQMDIRVSGARQCDAPPVVEGLDPFRVASGGSSSRVEIVNGRIRSGVDFVYYLTPSQLGTYEVGPARVQVEGRSFQSGTASLTIVKAPSQSSSAEGPLFLAADLSVKKAYVEEQVLYTLRLHLRTRVSNISLQLPEQDHISFQQLGPPQEVQGTLNGQPCQVIEVTYALMALKEGDYQMAPARMEMMAYDTKRSSRRGSFDDPFFSDPFFRSGRPVTVSSEPLRLNVLPLPEQGKPKGFSGLVGHFTIASELSPAKVRVGESATLTVQVSGRGNAHRIPDLSMPPLDSLKVYADQPVVAPGGDTKGLAGTKIMKWAIVPELPGDYTIPPLAVSFFDPKAGEYRTIQSREHALAVLPGKGKMLMVKAEDMQANGTNRPEKEAIQEIGRDVLPLHTSLKDLERGPRFLNGDLLLGTVLLFPFVGYVSIRAGLTVRKRSIQTLPAQRARRAARRLVRRCREFGDADPEGLMTAIREYINDRLGLSLASLTPEEATAVLTSRGVSHETSGKLRDAMRKLEGSIYAVKGAGDPGTLKNEIPSIVQKIEREIH